MLRNKLHSCMTYVVFRMACVLNAAYSNEKLLNSSVRPVDIFNCMARIAVTLSSVINLDGCFLHNREKGSIMSPGNVLASIDLYMLSLLNKIIINNKSMTDAESECIKEFTRLLVPELILKGSDILESQTQMSNTESNGVVAITRMQGMSPRSVFGGDSQECFSELMTMFEDKYEQHQLAAINAKFGHIVMELFSDLKAELTDMKFLLGLPKEARVKAVSEGSNSSFAAIIYGIINKRVDAIDCGDAALTKDMQYIVLASAWSGFGNMKLFAGKCCMEYSRKISLNKFGNMLREATELCEYLGGGFIDILDNIKSVYAIDKIAPDYGLDLNKLMQDIAGSLAAKAGDVSDNKIRAIIDFSKKDMSGIPVSEEFNRVVSSDVYNGIIGAKAGIDPEDHLEVINKIQHLMPSMAGESSFGVDDEVSNEARRVAAKDPEPAETPQAKRKFN